MIKSDQEPQDQAIISIHDLMPHTMDRVEAILDWLKEKSIPPVSLLVVPGLDWKSSQIDQIRVLAAAGHPIVPHGWIHHTRPRRLYHRLHAAVISRDVAEHLDLDSAGVLALLQRSRAWFEKNEIPVGDLYIPPSWALGSITQDDLKAAPFSLFETTTGLLTQSCLKIPLPLVGFEADTPLRQHFLSWWNKTQVNKARKSGLPLRISIHPDDLNLLLRQQLEEIISVDWEFIGYDSFRALL